MYPKFGLFWEPFSLCVSCSSAKKEVAEDQPMLIELKNGDTYNGRLVSCNAFMNICLKDVICTSKNGDKFWKMPECYIRGNTIKYLRIPDEIIHQVAEEENEQRRLAIRNNNNASGGRGGRFGRGRGRGDEDTQNNNNSNNSNPQGPGGRGPGRGRGGYHNNNNNSNSNNYNNHAGGGRGHYEGGRGRGGASRGEGYRGGGGRGAGGRDGGGRFNRPNTSS